MENVKPVDGKKACIWCHGIIEPVESESGQLLPNACPHCKMSTYFGYAEYCENIDKPVSSKDKKEYLAASEDEIPLEVREYCPWCHIGFPYPLIKCPECNLDLRNWKKECNLRLGKEEEDEQDLIERGKRAQVAYRRKQMFLKFLQIVLMLGVFALSVVYIVHIFHAASARDVSRWIGMAIGIFILIPLLAGIGVCIEHIIDYVKVYTIGWIKIFSRLKELLKNKQLIALERLRREFSLSDEYFAHILLMSSALGIKIIKRDHAELRKLYPERTEVSILKALLINDLRSDPDMGVKDLEMSADEALKDIGTLEQLCNFVESLERRKNPNYYESTLGKRIEEIIA